MNFKIEKSVVIKILIIGAALFIAPQVVPFALEIVLMADIMGLEALALLLIYQSRHAVTALITRFSQWRTEFAAAILLLANIYMFQPKVFVSHVAGSSVILLFACSVAMALALWIPAIYLSGGGFA